MTTNYTNISCGILQIYDLDYDPKEHVNEVLLYWFADCKDNYDRWMEEYEDSKITKAGIFSDLVDGERARRLESYIQQHKLGTIESTTSFRNTTHNEVKLWFWIFDIKAMWEHVHGR